MKRVIETSKHVQTGRIMYRGGVAWTSARGSESLYGDWTFDRSEAELDSETAERVWIGS